MQQNIVYNYMKWQVVVLQKGRLDDSCVLPEPIEVEEGWGDTQYGTLGHGVFLQEVKQNIFMFYKRLAKKIV